MKDKGIIFFNAPWCEPCKVLKPVINQIEKERYSPQSIPTLVLTDMGGTEIKRTQAGGWTKEQVMNWFYA